MKRKIPSLDKRHAKHRHLSQDEADLWRKTVEGVDASLPPPKKSSL
jgi:hypothetical protein